jgi:hypothetical protein
MRVLTGSASCVVLWLGLTVGCGESTTDSPGAGGGGTSISGGSSAGKPTSPAGNAGQSAGGTSGSGGSSIGEGGEPSSSGGAGDPLIDCDPKQVACKIATPTCPTGQVPSVEGTCYGECVKIEQCACAQAEQCPDSNQYTCWIGAKHCGPYVR